MKKLLTILFLFGSIQTWAQVSDAWKTQIESIFQHVNRSPVTTGLLTDYGLYFTNIDKFNGIPSDTNYIEFTEWQELYLSLYSCRFNTNATLAEPAPLFALIDSMATINMGNILFTGLHYKYERFKSNATPNLVYVSNNKIYDKPGRPTTPYEIKESFAFVPMISSLEGAVHTFLFKPEFFYSNMGKTISTLRIDFGDGAGYRTVTNNVPITINYSTEGEKILRFKLTYTDNSFKESRTKIEIRDIPSQQQAQTRYGGVNINEFNFPLTNFHAPKAYQGKIGKALVTVEYTNPEKKIRKPLIVVEGFDPWKIIAPGNSDKNFSFDDFISVLFPNQGINVDISYDYPGQTLSDALQGKEYDLIFVDFDNGTDFIQRNAYLVENIIEWVNSVKEPYNGVMQKNVVLGASMGGLVARYALRDLELDGKIHDTRLYASFDTPHQGANFPIGFQAMISHMNGMGIGVGLPGIYYYPPGLQFGNLMPEIGKSFKLLNSPAARQMLYYAVAGTGNLIFTDNTIHDAFMDDYKQKGYPVQGGIRNLVIANGSECGTDQGYLPHAEYVNFTNKTTLKWWQNLLGNVLSPLTLLTSYPQAGFGAPLTTRTEIKNQFIINALPNQQSKRVYYGRMYIKKKVLFVINVSITLFEKSFNAPASFLPIDNAGGGLRDLSEFASDLPFELKQSRFCFVPTFSALDIGAGTQPITYTEVVKPYSPAFPPASPKNVVASNFFANPSEAGASNEIHTQVTLRNGRWLFQEITGTPAFFSCSYQCLGTPVEAIISGQGIICTSQVYKINNLTVGSSAAWASTWSSAPYPTLVQNSPAANQCTITNTYQYPSATTLTATVTGACGTSILTKQIGSDHNNPIQAGTYNQEACYFYNTYNPGSSGSLPSTPNTPLYLRQGCMTIITLSSMGAKSVIYTGSVQPLYWNYNSGESKLYLQLPYMSGGIPFTFKISGQDEGACQNRSLLFFSYSQPYYSFSIAPNPVSDEQLNILAKPSEELLAQKSMESAAAELEYTVSLIDLATAETIGKQPIYFKGNLKERIDISKLRKGLYNLQISWGNEIQNIRFLKP